MLVQLFPIRWVSVKSQSKIGKLFLLLPCNCNLFFFAFLCTSHREYRKRFSNFFNGMQPLASVPLFPSFLAAFNILGTVVSTNNIRAWPSNSQIIFKFHAVKTFEIIYQKSIDAWYLIHAIVLYGSSKTDMLT